MLNYISEKRNVNFIQQGKKKLESIEETVEKINVNTNEYSIWNYVCFDWIKKWLLIYWPIHGRTRYLVVFKNDHYYERYESVVQPLISLLLQSTAFKLAFRAFKYLVASVIPPCILRIFSHSGIFNLVFGKKEHSRNCILCST